MWPFDIFARNSIPQTKKWLKYLADNFSHRSVSFFQNYGLQMTKENHAYKSNSTKHNFEYELCKVVKILLKLDIFRENVLKNLNARN